MTNDWKPAELADKIREGDLDSASSIAGILSDDETASQILTLMEEQGMDDDGGLHEIVSHRTATDSLRKARKNNDATTMSVATGLTSNRVEATGMQRLIDAHNPAAQSVIYRGQKGTGKTATALEVIRWMYREGLVEKFITNVPVRGMKREELTKAKAVRPERFPDWWLDEEKNEVLGELDNVIFTENISRFLEFAKEPGEKAGLFDEFSTSGNAYSNQAAVEAVMSNVVNAFRKSAQGSFRTVYIGHKNDTDIHPIVRENSDVVVSKESKQAPDLATVHESWDEYVSDDSWFRVRGIRDIPESSPWRYDTNWFAHLEWNLNNPDVQIVSGRLRDDWEEYQELDDDEEEDEGEEEQYEECRGTKTDGGDCGATVTHHSGFCRAHRSQWDGESTDPRFE